MRKITSIAAVLFASAGLAFAQDMQDALRYSFNEYQGTARSMAMGNAFTALGGDLGSIGINPAGSAINNYSQITLTPGLTLAGIKATYDPAPGLAGNNESYVIKANRTRLSMPNFGMVVAWAPDDNSTVKNIAFGVIANGTANYQGQIDARGINAETSILGEKSLFFSDNRYKNIFNNRDIYNQGYNWEDIVAARTGMVTTYGGYDDQWIGATETIFNDGSIGTAGLLDQRWNRVTSGYKYDMVINAAVNLSDMFYLGANLGIIALEYNSDTYYKEFAVNPNDFYIPFDDGDDYFDSMTLGSWYSAKGAGAYGKFGFIFVPVPEFRIGAAVQTPGIINIKEKWQNFGDIYYTTNKHNASEDSPEGNYEYNVKTPARFNIGAAFNFGVGVISADYEYTDYSTMRLREVEGHDHSAFNDANSNIKNFTGGSHMVRVGAEIKPDPMFAIRAGYNMTTSPEYEYKGIGTKKAVDATRHTVSAGFGYSSTGSFFCDLAVQGNFLPKNYLNVYGNYIDGINSPVITCTSNVWNVVMTFGWRF